MLEFLDTITSHKRKLNFKRFAPRLPKSSQATL